MARERLLVLLAGAGRAMKAQDIAAAIGEDVSDTSQGRRVETTRSRLKRLVKEGRVVEEPTAWFALAPAEGASGREARPRARGIDGWHRRGHTPRKRRDPAPPCGGTGSRDDS
ncbi:hypothetical protein GCM10010302_03990 [Streptomyces polychromogenes]|uniref:Uncharacterized protein n=1 Tax=Streptomyces polychromogenes TaxID=67342 RepID=A0ABP3EM49_9ACTN